MAKKAKSAGAAKKNASAKVATSSRAKKSGAKAKTRTKSETRDEDEPKKSKKKAAAKAESAEKAEKAEKPKKKATSSRAMVVGTPELNQAEKSKKDEKPKKPKKASKKGDSKSDATKSAPKKTKSKAETSASEKAPKAEKPKKAKSSKASKKADKVDKAEKPAKPEKSGKAKQAAKKTSEKSASASKTKAPKSTAPTASTREHTALLEREGGADFAATTQTIAKARMSEPGRRGQIASERARFELGEHAPVLHEELGTLPPGYGLTIVRGWIRDPRHVVMVWDVNDTEMVARAESAGWHAVAIRVLNEGGGVIADVPVGARAGTYHLEIPPGYTIKLALGIRRPDGFFETLALSGPVRVPPEEPAPEGGEYVTLALPEALDRRALVRAEPPPRQGHRPPSRLSPARRLAGRVGMARQTVSPEEWDEHFDLVIGKLDEQLELAAREAAVSWLDLQRQRRGTQGGASDSEWVADEHGLSSLDLLRERGPSSDELSRRGAPSSDELVRRQAPTSPDGHHFGK